MRIRIVLAAAVLAIVLGWLLELRKSERDECRESCLFAKYEDPDHPDTHDARIACSACHGIERGLVK